MINGKTRASLIGIAGAYLVYTAYQLFQGREDPQTTMSPAMMILFIALFALAGCALMVYAVRLWLRAAKDEGRDDGRDGGDGMNSMK